MVEHANTNMMKWLRRRKPLFKNAIRKDSSTLYPLPKSLLNSPNLLDFLLLLLVKEKCLREPKTRTQKWTKQNANTTRKKITMLMPDVEDILTMSHITPPSMAVSW